MKLCFGCMEKYDDSLNLCPYCGYVEGTQQDEVIHMLPGTRLSNRYIVGKVLGYGGFGVTYIGWDIVLEHKIAIKEYLPSEFSTRIPGQKEVSIFNSKEQYEIGLDKFVEEAKKIAKFNNLSGIVKVYDSFKENLTAYIIMEYIDGEDMSSYLKNNKKIVYKDVVDMMLPIIDSLSKIHDAGIIHRDISPDNIMITADGQIKLIDFGAARYATTSQSKSLSVIIKPGYSPEEQYQSRGEQGAHTDVYAVAATIYKMITGVTPPDSFERRAFIENKKKDMLQPISKFCKNIPKNIENAIMNALNVRIEDRTRDMIALKKELTSDKNVKRIYGKIGKVDLLKWPLWVKVTIPIVALILVVFGILLSKGVIVPKSDLKTDIEIPEGMTLVPKVTNQMIQDAEKILNESNLSYMIVNSEYSNAITKDYIFSQEISAGSVVENKTIIPLVVCAGVENVTIPNVVGRHINESVQLLEEAGFVVEIMEEYSEIYPIGVVCSQSSIDIAPRGSTISLIISKGSESNSYVEVVVPKLVGLDYEEAVKLIEDNHISVIVTYVASNTYAKGIIIKQSIPPNSNIKSTDIVELQVSSGKELVVVPYVKYISLQEAMDLLDERGLKYEIEEVESATVQKGNVIAQSIEENSSVEIGTVIKLQVSKGGKVMDSSDEQDKDVIVTFDSQGGSNVSRITVKNCTKIGDLPITTRTGYSFAGWYTGKNGTGDKITASTIVSSNITVYAKWNINTYTVTFNSQGGSSVASIKVNYNGTIPSIPVTTREYYTLAGWFPHSLGSGQKLTTSTKITDNITYYACWNENSLSDWVLESKVPSGGVVEQEKWTYTLTEYKTSTNSSESGWTLVSSSWKQTKSGSVSWANFPSGYDTSNIYYTSMDKSEPTAYDNGNTKRVVNTSFAGYIYWHWMYPLAEECSAANRWIYNKYGYCSFNGWTYTLFGAFKSSTNYTNSEISDTCGLTIFKVSDRTSFADTQGSYWWYKLEYYNSTYTDYQKQYSYKKVTNNVESATKVTASDSISNVKRYVKYRMK